MAGFSILFAGLFYNLPFVVVAGVVVDISEEEKKEQDICSIRKDV